MARSSSSGDWKSVELPAFETLAGSNKTCGLSRHQWPRWASDSTKFTRLLIHCPEADVSSSETTAQIVARVFTERVDPQDAPQIFNYNLYLLAEATDGRLYQSGPIPTTEPRHRSSGPSTMFDEYGPPPI